MPHAHKHPTHHAPSHAETPKHKPKPDLKLVKRPHPAHGKEAVRHENVLALVLAVVTLGALVLGTAGYLALSRRASMPPQFSGFDELETTFRVHGIERYLTEKAKLRDRVAESLRDPKQSQDRTHRRVAGSLALYLFPDLLDRADLMEGVAQESWGTLMLAIERAPRSRDSRLWFEEMRAAIWNFESPKGDERELSPIAKRVIRIYDVLSAP